MRQDTRTGARGRGGCKRSEHARPLVPARLVGAAAPLPLGSPLRPGGPARQGLALLPSTTFPPANLPVCPFGSARGVSRPERSGERSGALISPRAGTFGPCRRGVTRSIHSELVCSPVLVLVRTSGKAPGSNPAAFPVHVGIGLRDLISVRCPG